jgi:hypothetical protein
MSAEDMPLRAIVDGVECLAPLIGDDQWHALRTRVQSKAADVRLPCCGAAGHLRVSKNGTRHFFHARTADCAWKPETESHLLAKNEIVLGCADARWEAKTEVGGPDWRADVLATRGNVRIAFEIQWSSQTEKETRLRQSRYKVNGVRCCWFFRKPPAVLIERSERALPVFQLLHDATARQIGVCHLDRIHRLRDFAKAMLTGQVRFCERISLAPLQRMKIVFYDVPCWNCKFVGHDYHVEDNFRTPCGIEGGRIYESAGGPELQFEPQIVAAVQDFLRTDAARDLRVGTIKQRYSRTREKRYPSVGCARCDAIFGNFHKTVNRANAEYSRTGPPVSFEVSITCSGRQTIECPHWCSPTNGQFCEYPLIDVN